MAIQNSSAFSLNRLLGFLRRHWCAWALLGLGIVVLLTGCGRPPATTTPPTVRPLPATVAPPTIPAALSPAKPSPAPTSTLAPTPSLVPTSAPTITRTHTVKSGELLGQIALDYGVSVEVLVAANNLDSPDEIWEGQALLIPPAVTAAAPASAPPETARPPSGGDPTALPTVTATAVATLTVPAEAVWIPSILEGDLARAYPVTVAQERYTIHYPETLPESEQAATQAMLETAIARIEQSLTIHLEGRFDVYVAGSLFAAPDVALRGRSFSSQRRFFFLWDGSGDAADRQYIITHEATHTFTWNTMGRPASVMLHEGVAVFTGIEYYEAAGYIHLDDFCAILRRAGKLPLPSTSTDFGGHLSDLETYYSAGSFVRYLIETYGAAQFGVLYATGNYGEVYTKTQATLEAEWLARLEAREIPAEIDEAALVETVAAINAAYARLFAYFDGSPEEMRAYRALDQARLATLRGRFQDAARYLAQFEEAFASVE